MTMACPNPLDDERVELRWVRPDGTEAVAVVMRYATPEEASEATEGALDAFEEVRRAGTGSRLDAGREKVE